MKPNKEEFEVPVIEKGKLPEEGYDLSKYIVPIGQPRRKGFLLDSLSITAIKEDGPKLNLDDLADLEEALDNLQFFKELDLGYV
mgnify:CR=1 FL=1